MDFKNFKTHRPVDSSDPGFEIPGMRLRWTSGAVREVSQTSMMWTTIAKDKLPPKLVEHIERCYPGAFKEGGNTIRRGSGELVLSYMPVELAEKHRLELQAKSKEQQSRHRIMPKQEFVGKRDYAKIEQYEGEASSIPRQFLKKDEE